MSIVLGFVMFFEACFFQGWEEQLHDETQLDHDYSQLTRHWRLDRKNIRIQKVWYLESFFFLKNHLVKMGFNTSIWATFFYLWFDDFHLDFINFLKTFLRQTMSQPED